MIRLLALVACGTRTIIGATFGSTSIGETRYAQNLVSAIHRGMIVLADRNFAAQKLIAAIADTGAELMIRVITASTLRDAPPVVLGSAPSPPVSLPRQ